MTFKQWILSEYPNPDINGQWKLPHIIVLLSSIAIIITLALLFRKKSEKARKIVLWILVGLILSFELTRRIINLYKETSYTLHNILHILLPRPWCAISCWALILSAIINKKFFYNFASFTALLCAIVFFVYPGAGFNNQYILFENLYSISTHALLLITSISLITLKFTDFRYKTIWKELICYGVVLIYSVLEIYVLNISTDPMYFMPDGDIQLMFSLPYIAYLLLYIAVTVIYINAFYLINDRKKVFANRKKVVK